MTHDEIETTIKLLSAERDRVNELRRALDVAIECLNKVKQSYEEDAKDERRQ